MRATLLTEVSINVPDMPNIIPKIQKSAGRDTLRRFFLHIVSGNAFKLKFNSEEISEQSGLPYYNFFLK